MTRNDQDRVLLGRVHAMISEMADALIDGNVVDMILDRRPGEHLPGDTEVLMIQMTVLKKEDA